jgi:hypothetical protein
LLTRMSQRQQNAEVESGGRLHFRGVTLEGARISAARAGLGVAAKLA